MPYQEGTGFLFPPKHQLCKLSFFHIFFHADFCQKFVFVTIHGNMAHYSLQKSTITSVSCWLLRYPSFINKISNFALVHHTSLPFTALTSFLFGVLKKLSKCIPYSVTCTIHIGKSNGFGVVQVDLLLHRLGLTVQMQFMFVNCLQGVFGLFWFSFNNIVFMINQPDAFLLIVFKRVSDSGKVTQKKDP